MALTIGKLSILIGAGLLGSVLAKEGRVPGFSDFVSGAFKIALKPLKQSDSAPSGSKPKNDALVAQVNNLRQELQLLASSRPVTIVTSSTGGGRRYGVLIIVIVVGYGYVWWKGWKLPDLSFATKRGLSEATTSIQKNLEQVYSSVSATKCNLSSRIEQVDSGLTEVAELNDKINDEVIQLHGKSSSLGVDIKSFHETVQTLETKLLSIKGKEDATNQKVGKLVKIVSNLERNRPAEQLQASSSNASRPALERAQSTPSRIASVRPALSLEPSSPSTATSEATDEVQQPLKTASSAAGLKDLAEVVGATTVPCSPRIANGKAASGESRSPSLASIGWVASAFSRIRSAS